MAKALPPVSESVAYAAATYAVWTGEPVSSALFAYRSEAQTLIAGAVYLATKGLSWRASALAAFCPNDKNKITSLDMGFRRRREKKLYDAGLFAAMCLAARERRLVREEKTEHPKAERQALGTGIAKLVAEHIAAPLAAIVAPTVIPAEVSINPALSKQTWKPQTDLDKEIYGRPLNARHVLARSQSVSVPMPGDKPEGWVPLPAPAEPDEGDDLGIADVESRHLERTGSASRRSKKITLPRIRALEKDMPNG